MKATIQSGRTGPVTLKVGTELVEVHPGDTVSVGMLMDEQDEHRIRCLAAVDSVTLVVPATVVACPDQGVLIRVEGGWGLHCQRGDKVEVEAELSLDEALRLLAEDETVWVPVHVGDAPVKVVVRSDEEEEGR